MIMYWLLYDNVMVNRGNRGNRGKDQSSPAPGRAEGITSLRHYAPGCGSRADVMGEPERESGEQPPDRVGGSGARGGLLRTDRRSS